MNTTVSTPEFAQALAHHRDLGRAERGVQGVELADYARPDDLETTPSIYLREAEALGFKRVALEQRKPSDGERKDTRQERCLGRARQPL